MWTDRAGLGRRLGGLARGVAAAGRALGCTIDVGTAGHVTRHVLDAVNDGVEERTVRKVTGPVSGAGVWLKVFDDPATVGGRLGEGWWINPEPGHLMPVPLTATEPPAVPDGYRVRAWTRGGVTRVLLAAPDGSWATRGQVAPTGRTAVVDQVETSPAHRRRGLGSFVMRTLTREAVAQGAERGVLAGTPDGRALYEALGRRVEAPLTSAKFVGTAVEGSWAG
ncbi:hypothetical protein GCM10023084_09800 [Streptomyces lacrimifluminis]|uniref:N-acetyltransferase domain-containing protein n=1 Tax=Streptomyces lacrimifluminis TaxID=1500077 RepID=A0A917L8M3_9ACTN|nr:hypothetical protein GCM10012282_48960 [Streptomyces lacrimifluminis]